MILTLKQLGFLFQTSSYHACFALAYYSYIAFWLCHSWSYNFCTLDDPYKLEEPTHDFWQNRFCWLFQLEQKPSLKTLTFLSTSLGNFTGIIHLPSYEVSLYDINKLIDTETFPGLDSPPNETTESLLHLISATDNGGMKLLTLMVFLMLFICLP